jgi:3-oxoacyl-[acyl-carrier protein] reductase
VTKRIALVTGASRGIGRAILKRLGESGFIVVGTATTDEGATAIGTALHAWSVEGRGEVVRVDDAGSVDGLMKRLDEAELMPLVLVNNAGITRDNLLLRMKEEEWGSVIDTNIGALYRLCKPVLRTMTRARWGRIINMSSVVGRMGNGGQTNYAASKAAIEGFTRALAHEVGSRQITVNAVAPGFITTDMTEQLSGEQRDALTSRVPLGRLGTPEDVANVVAFLASDAAEYITGATIHVNGGMYMT